MSFLIRTLFVVGLIYLLSPLRAELPDWLINPSPEAARDVTPVLAQSAAEAVVSTCKNHEAACANVAKHVAGAVVANNDAQSAFEALVKQAAAMPSPAPSPANDNVLTPNVPALIEKTAPIKPKTATTEPKAVTADANAQTPHALNLSTIPLPPRRKI
jgi:hypothetical protein